MNKDEIRIRAFYSVDKKTKAYIDDNGLKRALDKAKKNYEGGDFVVEFELSSSESAV